MSGAIVVRSGYAITRFHLPLPLGELIPHIMPCFTWGRGHLIFPQGSKQPCQEGRCFAFTYMECEGFYTPSSTQQSSYNTAFATQSRTQPRARPKHEEQQICTPAEHMPSVDSDSRAVKPPTTCEFLLQYDPPLVAAN